MPPPIPHSLNSGSPPLGLDRADVRQERGQFVFAQIADAFGEQIGQLGGARAEAGGIDGDARMRDARQALQLFRLVPDDG